MSAAIYKNNSCTDLDRVLGIQEVEAPRIYRQLAHESVKVVSPKHRPPYPPPPAKIYPRYSFLLEAE
jgi:hypothetical protein